MLKESRGSRGRAARVDRILGSLIVIALTVVGLALSASAGSGPAEHAPIGVMGDHTHKKGEVMLSYRYMRMGMDGMRDNDDRISRSEVLADPNFAITPKNMDMEMHMLGAMYAPIERLTLMVMIPYVRLKMDHRRADGLTFTTRSEGLGDVRVSGMIDLWEEGHHKVHGTLGLSFPTGSITKQDKLPPPVPPAGQTRRLPYPMQLGTGTFDFLPALTYNGHSDAWSWGSQISAEIRLNENHADYRVGDQYALTAWGARELAKWVSSSLRLEWSQIVNIRGGDDNIVGPVPTTDPGRRAAMRLDLLAGVNFIVPSTPLEGIRFAVEAGVPIYERLDGPGLETDWLATVGVQYAF
jgi:hypothetical protein